MSLKRLFTEHPEAVGETYFEHMGVALSFAGPLLAAGLAALVHAVLPFLYVTTASGTVKRLHARMMNRTPHPPAQSTGDNLLFWDPVIWAGHLYQLLSRESPSVGANRQPIRRNFTMHPSFGIEYQCSSTKWEDLMKGPSREAVLAHTYKVLHYRELFGTQSATAQGEHNRRSLEETALAPEQVTKRYAAAA